MRAACRPTSAVADKAMPYVWETCMTMATQWSYKPHDKYKSCRCVLVDPGALATGSGGTLIGVQMIGSREGFRGLPDALCRPWQNLAPQFA